MKLCALKHDLVPVVVEDPREAAPPAAPAVVEVYDPETGARSALDLREAASAVAREEAARRADLARTFRSCGLEPVVVSTGAPTIDPLVAFFRRRARRMRR